MSLGGVSPRDEDTPRFRERFSSRSDTRNDLALVLERNKTISSMDPTQDPSRLVVADELFLELGKRTHDCITVEWVYCPARSETMPVDHFLLQHSSVTKPEYVYEKCPSKSRKFTITGCNPGANYFIDVSAVDQYGKVIVKSKHLKVQTSAPIDRPTIKLTDVFPDKIILEWNRPLEYGDGTLNGYKLSVNGAEMFHIGALKTAHEYVKDCKPKANFTFRIQAVSHIPEYNSEWSNLLDVTCPAALDVDLRRLSPKTINTVQVTWNLPICVSGARVKEFTVYYKKCGKDSTWNDQEVPDVDLITGNKHFMAMKQYKPDVTVSSLEVDPTKFYWAMLKADIVPEEIKPVVSQAIMVRATQKPEAPSINVTVYGLHERHNVNRKIAKLLDKRDRINRRKSVLPSNDITTGIYSDQTNNMNDKLDNIERSLEELIKIVNELTGYVPVVIRWEKPNFDKFCEPSAYRANVNNHGYQEPVPLSYTEHTLKLDVKKDRHSISLTTLSDHPVGHSEKSNEEFVETKEFRPTRFFCYFTDHKKGASWPEKNGCRLEDCLEQEKKAFASKNAHRGLLKSRTTPKSFKVLGVHDATWQQLLRHNLEKKSTIILFWTKWCMSSQNILEKYTSFSQDMKNKCHFYACCVKSGEDYLSHRQSVMDLLNERELRLRGNIRHCCACHQAPERGSDTTKRMEKASIPSSFQLVGVPTFVIIDAKGQLAWQGRIAADTDTSFAAMMNHALSGVDGQSCPNANCEHCKDEKGTIEVSDDEYEENDDNVTSDDYTIDAFNFLHTQQRTKTEPGDEERMTEGDQGSMSPRKTWRERRLRNSSNSQDEKQVRFVAVSGEEPKERNIPPYEDDTLFDLTPIRISDNSSPRSPRIASRSQLRSQSSTPRSQVDEEESYTDSEYDESASVGSTYESEKRQVRFVDEQPAWKPAQQRVLARNVPKVKGDVRKYAHRNPNRDYRSPNNGDAKPRFGYGSREIQRQEPAKTVQVEREEEVKKKVDPDSRYRYSTINYHKAGGDVLYNDHTRKDDLSLSYDSSRFHRGTPRSYANVGHQIPRDTSRGGEMRFTWPQGTYDDDDVKEFMIPEQLRKKMNAYNQQEGGQEGCAVEEKTPYVYTRPLAKMPQEERPSAKRWKSANRGRDKYAHLQSSYKQSLYKPVSGKPRVRRNKLLNEEFHRLTNTPAITKAAYSYNQRGFQLKTPTRSSKNA